MATTLYLVVTGHGTTAQIDRYLWFGTERIEQGTTLAGLDEHNVIACLLRVTEDTEADARRRAEAQRDRLLSGLHSALIVDTRAEADTLLLKAYEAAVDRIIARSGS